jgi:hypothetical protein
VREAVRLERVVRPRDPAIAAVVPLLDHGPPVAGTRSRAGLLAKTLKQRFR